MTTIPSSKFAKVRVFRFLDTSWTDILTGDMIIDSATRTLKIYYENSTNNHLIPACPAKDVQGDPRKLIEISVNRMSRVESDQTDSKIIYLWIDKNPFSISFLAEQKAKQTCQILQLLQQSEQILETQNQQEETSIEYLKNLIQSNPGMITTLFINNNLQTLIDLLVKLASLPAVQTGPPEDRQNYFLIFKSAIRVGDKNIIEKLISKENYQILLKVLSWNPFNKNPFNYVKEYDRMVSINNVLGITDPIIVQTYEENARIKFLRDVASCMFTEIDNERIFQSIININNQTLIFHIGTSDETLQQIKQKAESDPISFLNLFSELWEMYKSTNIEFQHKQIKQKFVDNFKQKGLHGAAVRAAFTILDNPKLSQQVNSRFHQKWLESFNPFLSNNWDYSQEWICTSKSKQCLIKLLQKLLTGTQDEHLIQIIVNFTRWLIQPSDNRLVMVAKFKCYVYDQLILKMWPIMKKSTILIQVYVDFILRAYRSDCVRARRVIIQNKVLSYLNKDLTKKSTLICVIKLLDGFLQIQNLDIFTYLNNNVLFKGLKQEYLRNARSRNIINSCFRCLLKKIEMTKNNTVRSYFSQIFLTKGIEA